MRYFKTPVEEELFRYITELYSRSDFKTKAELYSEIVKVGAEKLGKNYPLPEAVDPDEDTLALLLKIMKATKGYSVNALVGLSGRSRWRVKKAIELGLEEGQITEDRLSSGRVQYYKAQARQVEKFVEGKKTKPKGKKKGKKKGPSKRAQKAAERKRKLEEVSEAPAAPQEVVEDNTTTLYIPEDWMAVYEPFVTMSTGSTYSVDDYNEEPDELIKPLQQEIFRRYHNEEQGTFVYEDPDSIVKEFRKGPVLIREAGSLHPVSIEQGGAAYWAGLITIDELFLWCMQNAHESLTGARQFKELKKYGVNPYLYNGSKVPDEIFKPENWNRVPDVVEKMRRLIKTGKVKEALARFKETQ